MIDWLAAIEDFHRQSKRRQEWENFRVWSRFIKEKP